MLDKAGTITEGKPEVAAIAWKDGAAEDELSNLLLSIEQQFEHPLAEAVVRYFKEKNLKPLLPDQFESIT